MESEDGHHLLGTMDLDEKGEKFQTHTAVLRLQTFVSIAFLDIDNVFANRYIKWITSRKWMTARSCNLWAVWNYRQTRRRIIMFAGFAFLVLAVSTSLSGRRSKTSMNAIWSGLGQSSAMLCSSGSPFTGSFARFPRISALPKRQRRLTIIGVWGDNSFPSYLRQFFYTIQMNADVLDLVMINRVQGANSPCLDFEKSKVNITWGGNIKFYCMEDAEWKRRHVDFLCSSKYGWNCNSIEYEAVMREFQGRPDKKNTNWRPIHGYVFRDLFPNPDNPFWAWMDQDISVGNFARYPFNILSQLSILSGAQASPETVWMAGQLTAFNMDDEALATAWKKFPAMESAKHFTNYINGPMPDSEEEKYWSYGYIGAKLRPGEDLSWGMYSDLQGDDYYNNNWNHRNATTIYIISGRDVLLASTSYTRKEIEDLIRIERNEPIDDLGGLGWTGGEDGSAYLIDNPALSSSEAKLLAIRRAESLGKSPQAHQGIIEDQVIMTDCPVRDTSKATAQCLNPHPLTTTEPAIMRASLVHFKEQQPGHVLRRLEKDHRPRGYERKLFKHILKAKRFRWFELPPFDITEDLVLRYNSDGIEVFKMGPSREETLFYRKEGEKNIG
jgi:hypothetical protein